MRSTTSRKWAAILCAAVAIGFLCAYLALLFWVPLGEADLVEAAAVGFLAVCGLLIVTMIAGILAALILRIKELKRGEEDDAKQY